MRKKIVAGNWKMNTLPAEGVELAKGVVAGRGEVCSCVNFIVCPPFTHLAMVAEALKGSHSARRTAPPKPKAPTRVRSLPR